MTKIFMVEMKTQVDVAADDIHHAYDLADRFMFQEALSDSSDKSLSFDVLKEIKHVDELKVYNWDGKCIPYGDTDGNTRLDEILK
jgi:hypothetical protein